MTLLTAKDLTLGYDSGVVVKGLDFKIDSGDYLCIVGENGSGKTTLMKTILGLTEPLGGEIIIEGIKQSDIGYLPQQTQFQKDFPASVSEIVLSGCQGRMGLRPFYNKEEKEIARENMVRMGIENLSSRCFMELSGGQKQRVLLARALCAAKKVLLLDEPVSALDPGATSEMYELVNGLNKDGITIIMISHDIDAAINFANRILHIGNRIFFGTPLEYKNGGFI